MMADSRHWVLDFEQRDALSLGLGSGWNEEVGKEVAAAGGSGGQHWRRIESAPVLGSMTGSNSRDSGQRMGGRGLFRRPPSQRPSLSPLFFLCY